jgi:hypothetical protein
MVFRYFAVDTGIRVHNVRQFRYLWIRSLASSGKGGWSSPIMHEICFTIRRVRPYSKQLAQ